MLRHAEMQEIIARKIQNFNKIMMLQKILQKTNIPYPEVDRGRNWQRYTVFGHLEFGRPN